jgi:hypothetical protein
MLYIDNGFESESNELRCNTIRLPHHGGVRR